MGQSFDLQEMRSRWVSLVGELGVSEHVADSVFGELAAHYQTDGRAYHNLAHVQQVLTSAEAVAGQAVDWSAVQLAIWFHDVVYVPGAPDNEAQSAHYARRMLQSWQLSEPIIQSVEQLILATALNGAAPHHPDAPLIQDADIATLGWPPDAYRGYAQAIRQEFAHVPEEDYRHGRSQILTHFLQKPRLYHTDHFFTHLEAQARVNIYQELQALKEA